MKRILLVVLVAVVAFLFVACGSEGTTELETNKNDIEDTICDKTMCSIEGCENVAIDDTTFEEDMCANHLKHQKALITSKSLYENIHIAYEIIKQFSDDICEAWRLVIDESDSVIYNPINTLESGLSLNANQIMSGVEMLLANDDGKIPDLSYAEIKSLFKENKDSLNAFCIVVVINAYHLNGQIDVAQKALDDAKIQLIELDEKYSDFEHYQNLKDYYTQTSAFFDYLYDPFESFGTFKQTRDTIYDYQNNIRNYISKLDYIFEE